MLNPCSDVYATIYWMVRSLTAWYGLGDLNCKKGSVGVLFNQWGLHVANEVPVYRFRRRSPTGWRALPRSLFFSSNPPSRIMPSKILPSYKSSRRRLNTGSALTSRQEATPASAEVGPSTSSTLLVSLRGDAESAEVSSSLSGQPIMEITHFPFCQIISRKPLFSTRKPLYFTNNRS